MCSVIFLFMSGWFSNALAGALQLIAPAEDEDAADLFTPASQGSPSDSMFQPGPAGAATATSSRGGGRASPTAANGSGSDGEAAPSPLRAQPAATAPGTPRGVHLPVLPALPVPASVTSLFGWGGIGAGGDGSNGGSWTLSPKAHIL
jgi:hypothetical protein